MALAQQHAGEEGAKRHGQAKQVGQPGRQQHDDQCQQHEQLRRAGAGHFVEQWRQQPAADHHQAEEQQRSFAQRQRQFDLPLTVALTGEHRYQGQQEDGDQILKQQDANGVLAVGAENLAEAGQLLADNGRG